MNILTFDVEEWFHILDNESTKTEKEWNGFETRIHKNMDRIFEILDRKKQRATFFCLGWVAKKHREIIKKIDSLGYEVASHSDSHQLAYEQSRSEFRSDLEASVKSLEDVTGKKVRAYRVPGFSVTEKNTWVLDVLMENGIEIDSSIFPARRGHGGVKGFGVSEPLIIEMNGRKIKEFPISLYRVFGSSFVLTGGGYFRLLPYQMIRYMMNRSDYVMTYFHPRDFDSAQPVINELSFIRKFKSYYGLGSAFYKLEKLLDDFDFIDLIEADKLVNWNEAKVIKLQH